MPTSDELQPSFLRGLFLFLAPEMLIATSIIFDIICLS